MARSHPTPETGIIANGKLLDVPCRKFSALVTLSRTSEASANRAAPIGFALGEPIAEWLNKVLPHGCLKVVGGGDITPRIRTGLESI